MDFITFQRLSALHPYSIPTTWGYRVDSGCLVAQNAGRIGNIGRNGRITDSTQIYEGTNQVQRVVVFKHLLS